MKVNGKSNEEIADATGLQTRIGWYKEKSLTEIIEYWMDNPP